MKPVRWLAILIALAAATHVLAADPIRPRQPPGQTLPLKPARTLSIMTSTGTWMSADISRDGRTILFDMLGDLYTLPITGGTARQISSGLAFDAQPTVSPDGEWVAFVSDRSGADNVWVAKLDGSAARQISFGDDDTVLVSPAWSADGNTVFVSRFRADLNNYELWRYGLDGSETIVVPIKPAADSPRSMWRSTLSAAASRDGRHLWYARQTGGQDVATIGIWSIIRRDLASGAETVIITGTGARDADAETFFRPMPSPDGRSIAYGTHIGGRTDLRLRDLTTGEDRLLARAIDPDQAGASTWLDVLPRYAFTPDGGAIILNRNGGFRRIALDGQVTTLPLTINAKVAVGASTRRRIAETDVTKQNPVRARLAQAPALSPDGSRVAFSAMGGLYVQPVKGGAPMQLATGGDPAFQPSWSPDGRSIAFVTWSEAAGGGVWRVAADGSAPATRVDAAPAFFSVPAFLPDGATIVALRSSAQARRHSSFEYGALRSAELIAFDGGNTRVITRGMLGGKPHFVNGSNAIHILSEDGLIAVDPASGTRRTIAQVKGPGYYFIEGDVPVDDIRLAPDGRQLLVQSVQQAWLIERPETDGTTIELPATTLPHRRISTIGADYIDWNAAGTIAWSVGAQLNRLSSDSAPGARPDTTDLIVELPRDRSAGTLLLRGATALTMAGSDAAIPNADILIRDDRIAAIGPRGSFSVPADAAIRDLTGKIVMPGFIDVHDHIGNVRRKVLSTEEWGLRTRLAYGVTTSFDPSTLTIDMLTYQDMLDAGLMIGPRLRSTGTAIFSMHRFGSLDAVREVLHRYKDAYRLDNIKQYRTGNRRVRQWIAMAAREIGLMPTTEGALSMKLDLTQIMDGYAGNEHALTAVPLGGDVLALLKAMRTSYTTTLLITHGGAPAQDWYARNGDLAVDQRTRAFWPPEVITQKTGPRPSQPLSYYRFPAIAAGAAAVQRGGGLVGMGSHGDLPGLGYHWEMEAHAAGGMTPGEILHAATAGSAETIGRLDDLGTLEPGKLADLLILDADPRADIRNSKSIAQVMLGGRLYDSATLATLWPVARPAPTPWFAADSAQQWLPSPKD